LSKFKGNISKLGKIEIGTLAPEENEHADSDSKAFYSRLPGIVENMLYSGSKVEIWLEM
jgi:hypothetical protein